MIAIAAVDRNWSIGKDNKLLVRIPRDQKFFRETTLGKTVIMGRRTLESLPKKQPLEGRANIVLSRDPAYEVPGARVVHSVEEALEAVRELPPDDVFVMGGESIYRAFLPHTHRALITKIDFAYDADAAFPDLDRDPEWVCAKEGDEETYFDLIYSFTEYRRV